MKSISILLIVLVALAFSGLNTKNDTAKNSEIVKIQRQVANYESVEFSGWFDVEIVNGQEGTLILSGDENVLKSIVTKVKKGTLYLGVKKGIRFIPKWKKQTVKIIVPVKDIQKINVSGSGNLTVRDTLKAERFTALLSGSGNLQLEIQALSLQTSVSGKSKLLVKGKTRNFMVMASGSCEIDAYDLHTYNASTNLSGSADIRVAPVHNLKAMLSGSGTVYYRGEPENVEVQSSGSGKVLKE
ncbi:head GIN domain-containing protein [Flavobacteriaceae bacterium M23B6Z8]